MTSFDRYFARIRPRVAPGIDALPEEHQENAWVLVEAVALCAWNASRDHDDCRHEWVDARNEVVESGQICRKCYAIRPEPSGTEYVPDGAGCVTALHPDEKAEQMEDYR